MRTPQLMTAHWFGSKGVHITVVPLYQLGVVRILTEQPSRNLRASVSDIKLSPQAPPRNETANLSIMIGEHEIFIQ